MKLQAFGLVCLLTGVLAAPMQDQAQNSQQIQPQQDAPTPDPVVVLPPTVADGPEEGSDEGSDEGGDEAGEGEDNSPDSMMMMMMGQGQMHFDMDAFRQMVDQVQQQVDQIDQLMQEHASDTNNMMEALVHPMARLNQTMAMGVSRLALPAGGLGSIAGILGGGAATGKKPAALGLLADLLRTVSNLVENLLTRGPIGELLNGLLGGILGGVGGTVGGVLGGGALGGGAAAQVPDLLSGILGSVSGLVPGAGAIVGGIAPH